LGISASQLGILLSSFFWTYAACQILAGWLVDRFDVNWVLAAGFFLWSLATAATGLIHGFAVLLVLRLLLGIGESVAYPCYSKSQSAHSTSIGAGYPECRDRRWRVGRRGHAGGGIIHARSPAATSACGPGDCVGCQPRAMRCRPPACQRRPTRASVINAFGNPALMRRECAARIFE